MVHILQGFWIQILVVRIDPDPEYYLWENLNPDLSLEAYLGGSLSWSLPGGIEHFSVGAGAGLRWPAEARQYSCGQS